ncbi:beta-1,4-N-acetylgalactosaminyltransferase bre-4-like [Daktulosphaira vitifoliae]|uniref:beta-1,4-N-acetylgalactosaminyltransferase bre-4-like n=1 Tax=Daktulosphaira vitifoliae TaxID=58002 RepID=UPI0021AA6E64|nr:beta-1,4-N-acetylgalactosaminyltransferase bre-4-like [Daktulosphaira vitifoliae]
MNIFLLFLKRKLFIHWLLKISILCFLLIIGIVIFNIFNPTIIHISSNDIPKYLLKTNIDQNESLSKRFCPIAKITKHQKLERIHEKVSEIQLNEITKNVSFGGEWFPKDCISQHHTAIIVCYRNRTEQLKIFLYHIHSFLQKQNLHYEIFVVEQTFDTEFNRGKLFNVGFHEVIKHSSAGCFIFHDVDLLPENINNIYGCTSCPRHMSSSINIFNYTLPYYTIFGGAIALTRKQYKDINGFSNVFYGWGGEDDDIFNRVYYDGYRVCRYELDISRYTMLTHSKETPNENRMTYLRNGPKRFKTDGVNSVTYILIKYEKLPLYTKILVSI